MEGKLVGGGEVSPYGVMMSSCGVMMSSYGAMMSSYGVMMSSYGVMMSSKVVIDSEFASAIHQNIRISEYRLGMLDVDVVCQQAYTITM